MERLNEETDYDIMTQTVGLAQYMNEETDYDIMTQTVGLAGYMAYGWRD